MTKRYVYRCLEGCKGMSTSTDKKDLEKLQTFHEMLVGHKGKVTSEDASVIWTEI